jgi:alginate O-acetyltransferase complex protein AlgI
MLFNSAAFIFAFLPATFCAFYIARRFSASLALFSLLMASLVFYAYWDIRFLTLLVLSIAFNYCASIFIFRLSRRKEARGFRRAVLIGTIAANLVALAFFKYSNFLVSSVMPLFNQTPPVLAIILPLGVSFYVFTQIAFLVDTYRSKAGALNVLEYALFVAYFPHLIAGPILHHSEMIPQFRRPACNLHNIALGLSIFSIGLFKKVMIADTIGITADRIFNAATHGVVLDMVGAWVGALSYTLQLYFDFSGYSEMAIGLSLLFGIRIPANFNSPYKATSIIDFWRRWHMTLSRFLRDYLYIPLGGNRHGMPRRYFNIFVTMLLGGLWHGASWTFVAWGALHGTYLIVNHFWRAIGRRAEPNQNMIGRRRDAGATMHSAACQTTTFIAVVIAWVFFRAPNFTTAFSILRFMVHIRHAAEIQMIWSSYEVIFIAAGLLVVWAAPNVLQMTGRYRPAILVYNDTVSPIISPRWAPSPAWGAICGFAAAMSILCILISSYSSRFLYFQF